eukprot:gene6260-6079_t
MAGVEEASSTTPPGLCNATGNSVYNGNAVMPPIRGLNETGDCCTACTRQGACSFYTWHPATLSQQSWCLLQSGGGTQSPSNPDRGFASGSVSRHVYCGSNADCSLAGECRDGVCVCDGWTHGEHCEVLNLLPADPARPGYRSPDGYNTWGGASLPGGDGTWYLFLSRIAGRCPLDGYWSSHSEAVRLASEHPQGPWSDPTVVVPVFAHNVKPFAGPDGETLVYYVGSQAAVPPSQCNRTTPAAPPPHGSSTRAPAAASLQGNPQPTQAAGPVMVASAGSPGAPAGSWLVHGPMTDSTGWHSATNPSPVFAANGT